jgi:hypothetical protein
VGLSRSSATTDPVGVAQGHERETVGAAVARRRLGGFTWRRAPRKGLRPGVRFAIAAVLTKVGVCLCLFLIPVSGLQAGSLYLTISEAKRQTLVRLKQEDILLPTITKCQRQTDVRVLCRWRGVNACGRMQVTKSTTGYYAQGKWREGILVDCP